MEREGAEKGTGGGEFAFIARHFRPLAGDGGLGLRDDCALLSCPPGEMLAISTDTMVETVHFLPGDPPDTLGRKLLRCNLSDLASMGAKPLAYTLNVTLPAPRRQGESWFEAFVAGLSADQSRYGVVLIGGDTTSTPGPLVLSATVFGTVKAGREIRRSGARPGDGLWVTGTIGDAALGLLVLLGKLDDPDPAGPLARRYHLPDPPVALAASGALDGLVSAAMDVSDGLIQDCGHLARESGVAAVIDAGSVPVSEAALALGPERLLDRLTGGDDYQLLMTCPSDRESALRAACAARGVTVTRIGHMEAGSGVRLLDAAGNDIPVTRPGWQHF